MSFRTKLVIGFAGLAIGLALLFSLLSDELLRRGLDGEAGERLAIIAGLYPALSSAENALPDYSNRKKTRQLLKAFREKHHLLSAVLILEDGSALGGSDTPKEERGEDYIDMDGVSLPRQVQGMARVSAPLFQDEKGEWVKAGYFKLEKDRDIWLRLEAGTSLLASVAKLRQRLFWMAVAVGLPALLAGVFMAWSLSRRVQQLESQLSGKPSRVHLDGRDEFTHIAQGMDRVLQDLSQQRRENETLHRARLDQAKSLSWGVAHELRNPLGGLSLLGELLGRKAEEQAPPKEIKELVKRMKTEIDRLESTVATFLEFAKTPQLTMVPVEIVQALREAARSLMPVVEIQGQSSLVKADEKALRVLLGVLLNNACEAAGENGEVRALIQNSASHCQIEIWDSGEAVPQNLQPKVFNPFYTTKSKGLGLGLANALALADAMRGSLTLSQDGKTFSLRLAIAGTETL